MLSEYAPGEKGTIFVLYRLLLVIISTRWRSFRNYSSLVSNVMFRFCERPISFNFCTYLTQASRKTFLKKTSQCVNPHTTSSMFMGLISKTHHKTTPTFLLQFISTAATEMSLTFKTMFMISIYIFLNRKKCPGVFVSVCMMKKSKSTTPHLSRHGTQSCHWECGWSPMDRPSRPQQHCPRHAAAAQSTCVPRTYRHIHNTA